MSSVSAQLAHTELSVTSQSLHTKRQAVHRHHTRGQYCFQILFAVCVACVKKGSTPLLLFVPVTGLKDVASGLHEKFKEKKLTYHRGQSRPWS